MRSIISLSLSLLFAASAHAQPAGGDWQEGLSLYRAGDYARACPLLRKVAEAAGTQGEPWADLGLCELKWGRRAESLRALNLAARYGDEKTRKAAYSSLGLAGVNLVPQTARGALACAPLTVPNELECKQQFAVCGLDHGWMGYHFFKGRRFELLIFPCREVGCPKQIPDPKSCAATFLGECLAASIELFSEQEFLGDGATPAWSCMESSAVRSRAVQCELAQGVSVAECMRTACAEAQSWQKAPKDSREEWTKLKEELEQWDSIKKCELCYERTTQTQCTLVSLNPCTGQAGAVCREHTNERDFRTRERPVSASQTVVQEFKFQFVPFPAPDKWR